jgi:arginine/lysine/ornithine decarboxylase
MTAREALLSPAESLPAVACLGRTLAVATVGCPPAVPILVSGEVVDEEALALFAYYGITSLRVTK